MADVSELPDLLRGNDRAVLSDKGYVKKSSGAVSRLRATGPTVSLGSSRKGSATGGQRYRGIPKNAAQIFTLIGLTNLYLANRQLMLDAAIPPAELENALSGAKTLLNQAFRGRPCSFFILPRRDICIPTESG